MSSNTDRPCPMRQDMLANANLPLPLWELVAIVASLMSLNALAIDVMLPALGDVAESYNLQNENDQQLVIFSYIIGFGVPQLFFGPISDRYGRRGLLCLCLIFYSLAAFTCMTIKSFQGLLILRFIQGVFASGIRVVAVSIVRDLIAGRAMAKVMSLVMTVFMIVPILAPAIGQGLMYFAKWQWTFGILGIAAGLVLLWVLLRLPETLHVENRQILTFTSVLKSFETVVRNRVTLGYMTASGLIFGSLFAFIGASEQIFDEVFGRGNEFAIWFAVIASTLAIANLINANLVERFGMRRISHFILFVFLGLASSNYFIMTYIGENFAYFLPLFALLFGCFGMIGANFSAIAMEPQGKVAGTASAVYGFATSTLSAWIGLVIARQFDGTVTSILSGFVGLSIASITIVLITERGRLFEVGQGIKPNEG